MKYYNLIKYAILLFPQLLIAQTFNANIASPIDLTGANGNCSSPGSGVNVVEIPVSDVGILNSSNALNLISVTLSNSCTSGSVNLNLVQYRIMAPDGTCAGVYNGGLTTTATGSHTINLVSPQPCLRNPNTANGTGGSEGSSGNYGFFNAQFGGVGTDLTSTFNGVDADGTWRIIFSESTSSEPCLEAASIRFGDPETLNETGNGNTCASPINYVGGPLCAGTSGMTGELNSPGSNTGQGDITISTFANGSCEWNGNNNNDVWISFVASSTSVCISISGMAQNLQSIVVSNPTGDGSACPANGEGWNLISCPRNSIYTTTAGTQNNQQHCFSATVGNTYYLVVDGNGGAESPFYVNGTLGTDPILPVEWLYFKGLAEENGNHLFWATATEKDNSNFIIEKSADGLKFVPIETINSNGFSNDTKTYSYIDKNPTSAITYYRLKQNDFNTNFSYSNIIAVNNEVKQEISVYPNPASNFIYINAIKKDIPIQIYDSRGIIIFEALSIPESLDISHLPFGLYYLKTTDTQLRFFKK
jgi:hypothetical protein